MTIQYTNASIAAIAIPFILAGAIIFSQEDKKHKKKDKKHKKDKKTDSSYDSHEVKDICCKARNFKSQLGITVASDPNWKLVNTYFLTNEQILKANALIINNATDQATYAIGATALTAMSTSSGFRILVTLSDGTVRFDSSKGINNTWANANSKSINENHNTRPAIMSAQLTCDGNGNELKFSTSTQAFEAYSAKRIVNEYGANNGTVRVSL